MPAFYKAKFEGRCGLDSCPEDRKIRVGDAIVWNPKSKPVVYFHESCMGVIKKAREISKDGDDRALAKKMPEGPIPYWLTLKAGSGIRVGYHVKCDHFMGTVYQIHGSGASATVKRDDGRVGNGAAISEPPYDGAPGWVISWRDGEWLCNGNDQGPDIPCRQISYFMPPERMAPQTGQWVSTNDLGRRPRIGDVVKLAENGAVGVVWATRKDSFTIKRDDGKEGGGSQILHPPYNGRKGWDVADLFSVWVPNKKEPTEPGGGTKTPTGLRVRVSPRELGRDLRVGDRVVCRMGGFGTIYHISTDAGDPTYTVRRDDGEPGTGVPIAEPPYNGARGWTVGLGSILEIIIDEKDKQEPREEEMPNGEGAETPVPVLEKNGNGNGHGGLKKMADLLAPYMLAGVDKDMVERHVKKAIEPYIEIVKELSGAIPNKIEVVRADGEVKKMSGVHQLFETLLKLVNARDHVYLWGPPGSGKSTAAHQVADALGLQFGYISLNPQTPDSRILGYLDASGIYRTTIFRKMYEEGGVMCIDEMDNAAPSLCVTVNSGLESDQMAFPDGMVKRSKDFVLVATGNTTGRGASPSFPERRPFDAAFAERFTFLEWDYDHKLEKAVTLSINKEAVAWLEWVLELRKYCKKHHPRLIVSPRASFKGAKLWGQFEAAHIAEMAIFKGLDQDTVKSILTACKLPS